ncbi:hypothetical protein WMZ97_10640 [Lentibacillus sp. N15]|uniref:hypothetical protein n=1 Tax=Lentibacillus songyuanensis TaxID=3136161 RepID=UPI0031B9D566
MKPKKMQLKKYHIIPNALRLGKMNKGRKLNGINQRRLSSSLDESKQKIMETTGNSDDIVYREMLVGKNGTLKVGIFFTDGLVNETINQESFLE